MIVVGEVVAVSVVIVTSEVIELNLDENCPVVSGIRLQILRYM